MGIDLFRFAEHPENGVCIVEMAVEELGTTALFIQIPALPAAGNVADALHGEGEQLAVELFVDGLLQEDVFGPEAEDLADHQGLVGLLGCIDHLLAELRI